MRPDRQVSPLRTGLAAVTQPGHDYGAFAPGNPPALARPGHASPARSSRSEHRQRAPHSVLLARHLAGCDIEAPDGIRPALPASPVVLAERRRTPLPCIRLAVPIADRQTAPAAGSPAMGA